MLLIVSIAQPTALRCSAATRSELSKILHCHRCTPRNCDRASSRVVGPPLRSLPDPALPPIIAGFHESAIPRGPCGYAHRAPIAPSYQRHATLQSDGNRGRYNGHVLAIDGTIWIVALVTYLSSGSSSSGMPTPGYIADCCPAQF